MSTGRDATHPRHEQMFPVFAEPDMDRLRRFGTSVTYSAGEQILLQGDVAPGLILVCSGRVEAAAGAEWSGRGAIITHGPGQFLGELAQLSDRPALVDAVAAEPIDAIIIPSGSLRDLLVQEAELGERIMRALILRRAELLESGIAGPLIVGVARDALVLRLQDFLRRNGQPYRLIDPDEISCMQILVERFEIDPYRLPIVLCPSGEVLLRPSERELASCLGLVPAIDQNLRYDVAIVGAGPAGLSAAVYAGSEGLSVIVLDRQSFGGQAGASTRIENYLGFPTGISGMALMSRAYNQALKFGVEFAIPEEAVQLERDGDGYTLRLQNGERVKARVVVIASGARYRRLDLPEMASIEGTSVHFWASSIEAALCAGQAVALVGAGNSAGQAAVYLAGQTKKVSLFCRRGDLNATMSHYLVQRIAAQPNIEVLTDTEICGLDGSGNLLDGVRWRRHDGLEGSCQVSHLFLFIGADPNTDWLRDCGIDVDPKGFIVTGKDAGAHPLETSRPCVFAIGDVRAGSVKRVAAAVGEGAHVVAAIHGCLLNSHADASPTRAMLEQ